MNKLQAEVQHQQAVLQQLEKEHHTLAAKARVLEYLVTSGDAAFDLLQTEMQGMHTSSETDIGRAQSPVNHQQMTSNNKLQAAGAGSDTYTNGNSNGSSSPTAVCNGMESIEAHNTFQPQVLGNKPVYEPGKEAAPDAIKQFALLHEARETYRRMFWVLAAAALRLEMQPDDPTALTKLQDIINSLQSFRILHRMPVCLLQTCDLETGEMNRLPPEGHWRKVALLAADR